MKRRLIKASILLLISILLVFFSRNIGMFWDNVLFASKMGKHLYLNSPLNWNMPDSLDAGHPPLLATIMALGWKVLGRSLEISHYLMLPFIFGLLWQLYSFVSFFVKERKYQPWAMLLVLADPTLSSQLILVNPEIIQLFFFFLALNSLLRQNSFMKVLSLVFLGLVSYRGMMLCAGIFLVEVVIDIVIRKKSLNSILSIRLLIEYFIGALPALVFIAWRLINKGWIINNPAAIWARAWDFDSVLGFLENFGRNIVILLHRFADFGRLGVLVFILIAFWYRRGNNDPKRTSLLIISIFSTLFIIVSSLIIRNPIGHRYFIPSYLSLSLLAFLLLKSSKWQKTLYFVLLLSLVGGNFLIYPEKIAQGWDASLAHLPYWNLRKEALEYMDDNNIDINETASFFPNISEIDDINLNGDKRKFLEFSGKENYVFCSNVFNLSDADLDLVNNHYTVLKQFKKGRVYINICNKSD
ncbi:MAG: hypothetical protein QNK33_00910 [Bacteroidales bacterium]|nr:hypothetical protein [Bacteroidales bacterium]